MAKDQPKPATGEPAKEQPSKEPETNQPKPATGVVRKWSVSVPGGPTELVEADTPADAFAAYKQRCGIVKSKAQPTIVTAE